MDFTAFLESLKADRAYRDQIVREEAIPPRAAHFGELSRPLPAAIAHALAAQGIEQLYSHQVEAVEAVRAGRDVVVVTGTASGKTLCYNLPVLETLLAEPDARAFYLFPTKALAQDQLRGLRRLGDQDEALAALLRCGTYDGDTPPTTRRQLRREANIVLTNPDMLHAGILPYHSRWASYFLNLKYIVVDEIHTYRGIFGSHVANVLRRLNRICAHYGSSPQYICSSATIANPVELAEGLTSRRMTLVDEDGAPRGPKHFVFWNPPYLDPAGMSRRSSNDEAHDLMVSLMRQGVQTIAFTKARIVAELLYRYCRESLERLDPRLAHAVRPYRAGYLPEDRREIERLLFSGKLLGVTSTNALELGIDVGSLDASLIVGYPGTIASAWQQAGRAGRGADESLVILIAYHDPIDQYLMRHPEYFFGRSPEHAIIDPENPYLLSGHLRCAAFELPLTPADAEHFGPLLPQIAEILQEIGQVQQIDNTWYWANTDYPAAQVSLRTISDDTFTIVDTTRDNRVIGQVDAISAPELVFPEAVYLHDGQTYLVRELDLNGKVAYIESADVDYYTNAVLESHLRVKEQTAQKAWRDSAVCYGEVTVSWATVGFKKIKFYTLDSIGYGRVDLPGQSLETNGAWLTPGASALDLVRDQGRKPIEGLCGIRNVIIHVLPLFAMCDRADIGGIVDSSNTGSPSVFLYDRYSGGLGFAEKGYQLMEQMLEACLALIQECECEDGCPSCVGLPLLRPPIHIDPDVMGGMAIPDKEAALIILHALLGRETYAAKPKRRRRRPPAAPEPPADAPSIPADTSVANEITKKIKHSQRRPRIGL
jgi:DEAD/DEAH box helicase domain-containing protein